MMGLLRVAATAAIAAISFIPSTECRKVPAAATGALSPSPVVLAQINGGENLNEVPCDTVQLLGPLGPGEFVKLTGAGWGGGPLVFLVSKLRGGLDQTGDSAVGSPLYSVRIVPPAEGEEQADPDAGKIYMTDFSSSTGAEPTTKDISLPIGSADYGFMFVCSVEAGVLKCKVSGYDNKQDDKGEWKSETIDLPLLSGSNDLRFSLQGNRVRALKLYASSGLNVATKGAALNCRAEDAMADHGASATAADKYGYEELNGGGSELHGSSQGAAAEEA